MGVIKRALRAVQFREIIDAVMFISLTVAVIL